MVAEELGQVLEDLTVNPAFDEASALAGPDEPGLPQLLQVVRCRRWCDAEAFSEVAHTPARVAVVVTGTVRHAARRQPLEELKAVGIRERREDPCEPLDVVGSTFRHASNHMFGLRSCQASSGAPMGRSFV